MPLHALPPPACRRTIEIRPTTTRLAPRTVNEKMKTVSLRIFQSDHTHIVRFSITFHRNGTGGTVCLSIENTTRKHRSPLHGCTCVLIVCCSIDYACSATVRVRNRTKRAIHRTRSAEAVGIKTVVRPENRTTFKTFTKALKFGGTRTRVVTRGQWLSGKPFASY